MNCWTTTETDPLNRFQSDVHVWHTKENVIFWRGVNCPFNSKSPLLTCHMCRISRLRSDGIKIGLRLNISNILRLIEDLIHIQMPDESYDLAFF